MVQVISLLSWWKKFFISLVLSIILFVSVVAEFRLNFEKFSISPLQAYSFRCWFSNNSVITFLEMCFPSSFCDRSWHFLLHFFYCNDLSSILPSGGIVMLLSSLIISNCEDRVLFMLIHLTGVLCHLFKFFHLIKFCPFPNLRAV